MSIQRQDLCRKLNCMPPIAESRPLKSAGPILQRPSLPAFSAQVGEEADGSSGAGRPTV